MQTTLRIVGLEIYGYHGLFEEERVLGQKFVFDIEARLFPSSTHVLDDMTGSVRYDAIIETIASLAGEKKFRTLEALGESMALALLEAYQSIETISIAVSKPTPPIPHALKSVGVAIVLTRDLDAGR